MFSLILLSFVGLLSSSLQSSFLALHLKKREVLDNSHFIRRNLLGLVPPNLTCNPQTAQPHMLALASMPTIFITLKATKTKINPQNAGALAQRHNAKTSKQRPRAYRFDVMSVSCYFLFCCVIIMAH